MVLTSTRITSPRHRSTHWTSWKSILQLRRILIQLSSLTISSNRQLTSWLRLILNMLFLTSRLTKFKTYRQQPLKMVKPAKLLTWIFGIHGRSKTQLQVKLLTGMVSNWLLRWWEHQMPTVTTFTYFTMTMVVTILQDGRMLAIFLPVIVVTRKLVWKFLVIKNGQVQLTRLTMVQSNCSTHTVNTRLRQLTIKTTSVLLPLTWRWS